MEYYEKKLWIERLMEPLEDLLFGVPGKGKREREDNLQDFLARVKPEKNATLDLEVMKVGEDINMMNDYPGETIQVNLRYKDRYQSTLFFYHGANSDAIERAKRDAIEIGKEIKGYGFDVKIMNKTLEEYQKAILNPSPASPPSYNSRSPKSRKGNSPKSSSCSCSGF